MSSLTALLFYFTPEREGFVSADFIQIGAESLPDIPGSGLPAFLVAEDLLAPPPRCLSQEYPRLGKPLRPLFHGPCGRNPVPRPGHFKQWGMIYTKLEEKKLCLLTEQGEKLMADCGRVRGRGARGWKDSLGCLCERPYTQSRGLWAFPSFSHWRASKGHVVLLGS